MVGSQVARRIAMGFQDKRSNPVQGTNGVRRE